MLKVSRLLATGLEILVANAKFLVALATSWSQFRTLSYPIKMKVSIYLSYIHFMYKPGQREALPDKNVLHKNSTQ